MSACVLYSSGAISPDIKAARVTRLPYLDAASAKPWCSMIGSVFYDLICVRMFFPISLQRPPDGVPPAVLCSGLQRVLFCFPFTPAWASSLVWPIVSQRARPSPWPSSAPNISPRFVPLFRLRGEKKTTNHKSEACTKTYINLSNKYTYALGKPCFFFVICYLLSLCGTAHTHTHTHTTQLCLLCLLCLLCFGLVWFVSASHSHSFSPQKPIPNPTCYPHETHAELPELQGDGYPRL